MDRACRSDLHFQTRTAAADRRAARDAAMNLSAVTVKAAFAWSLLAVLMPIAANSKCGTGNPPSYDDIDAVMFTQNGCKGTIQDADVSTLRSPTFPQGWSVSTFGCSTFWAFFWNNGRNDVATSYSQYNLKNSVGLFDLSATLDDARATLKNDHFFVLNPASLMVTDTARAVLSVRRCGVITRISVYSTAVPEQDSPTLRLFDDLRALISGAGKKRISNAPKDFEETGIFDP